MKKCVGCGATLQTEDKTKIGYVRSLDMDLCERCFRLKNYGDLTIDMRNDLKEDDVFAILENEDGVIVMVVDILNAEFAFNERIKKAFKGRKMIVIFNKLDILPSNTNIDRYEKYLTNLVKERLKGIDILAILLAHKFDNGFKDLFFDTIRELNEKRFIFIGYFNAGKSTIFNRLIDKDLALTSYYPSTTVGLNEVKIDDITFIDSPGLIYEDNILFTLDKEDIKKVTVKKAIKPKVYQLYSEQAYIIDDLIAISLTPKDNKASVAFYIDQGLDIHRTKKENLDVFIREHRPKLNATDIVKHYTIDVAKTELIINGLGVISIKNIKEVRIKMISDINIIERECVF